MSFQSNNDILANIKFKELEIENKMKRNNNSSLVSMLKSTNSINISPPRSPSKVFFSKEIHGSNVYEMTPGM